MATRKYFSLTFLGIGLVLAGFATFSSRTQAPVLPAAERNTAAPPPRANDAGKVPAGSVTSVPSDAPQSSEQTAPVDFLHASLVIGEKTYDLPFGEGETLYQAMARLRDSGAIAIEGKIFSGIGFFIEGLNGQRNGNGKYWVYSINGAKATLGAEGYRPKAGDRVVWTFEEAYE